MTAKPYRTLYSNRGLHQWASEFSHTACKILIIIFNISEYVTFYIHVKPHLKVS